VVLVKERVSCLKKVLPTIRVLAVVPVIRRSDGSVMAIPTPWAAHKGFGENGLYPAKQERLEVHVRSKQWRKDPIKSAVTWSFHFALPGPKGVSKETKTIWR